MERKGSGVHVRGGWSREERRDITEKVRREWSGMKKVERVKRRQEVGGKEGRRKRREEERVERREVGQERRGRMLFCSKVVHFSLESVFSSTCLLSPCMQRERQKDREKLRKKKESDLPGAVMQMNKYATNEAFNDCMIE